MRAARDHGSHLPALAWAVANTQGPILELGGGRFSTPYLVDTGRPLTTVETDPWWRNELLQEFPDLDVREDIPEGPWGLVFVDNEPESDRRDVLDSLEGRYSVAVVHDVWPARDPKQRYPDVWNRPLHDRHWWYVPDPPIGPPTLVVAWAIPSRLTDGRVVRPKVNA